jgi:cell division protein FtsB
MIKRFEISKLVPFLKNKYFLVGMAFVFWVMLFDENNLIERRQLAKEMKQLEKDKEYYQEKIQIDAVRLKELQTNDKNLEKFAREQYLMKREDEDVFVVVHE